MSDLQNWLRNNFEDLEAIGVIKPKTLSESYRIDDELSRIVLEKISMLIDRKLYLKFRKNSIINLGDLLKFTITSFSELNSVGTRNVAELKLFLQDVEAFPDKYLSRFQTEMYGDEVNRPTDQRVFHLIKNVGVEFVNHYSQYVDRRASDILDLLYHTARHLVYAGRLNATA